MSKFQIIVVSVSVAVGVIAVLMFAGIIPGFRGGGTSGIKTEITIWGIFSEKKLTPLFSDFNNENLLFSINYVGKAPDIYENELIDALASGKGPDVWIFTQDMILRHKNKVFAVPFEYFKERSFRDSFIDSAELFLDTQNKNIIGFPLAVDPIVLYWNRDLFSSAGIAMPPRYWDEFLTDAQALTKIDGAGNITQSGAAMGEFRNVKNAKEILSMLILQTGNPIVNISGAEVVWEEKGQSALSPVESSVRFFNEFSNPSKSSYSWNRALFDSETMFASGSLAMYFGYASEFEKIKEKNPHLNFDIAEVPQIRDGKIMATFGKIYSLAVSKNSKNTDRAYAAAIELINDEFSEQFASMFNLGSSRRDILAKGVDNPILSIVYKSAIMSRTWLDPNPLSTYEIFKNMVESTATGKVRVSDAAKSAETQIEDIIKYLEFQN
ncbi:extracellular solute-binding protein [Candidatus Parcubacteria bacterium]|nr:extracellular solute-binding protein [Patescibacteria group bacterium]MBU4477371.1 extracellular solute-binding protein [Patescibacteria group bacterium]MCG2699261.1 extracellular solute-binding protein [Candidatus Parcubacteria bacterium]